MKAVLLNSGRLDYDGRLSFAPLEAVADLVSYETTEPDQVIERAAGCEVLISKELPLPAEVIKDLPDEVGLICEAGTGVDNVHLPTAGRQGIMVCNVPGYSTQAVAQLTMCFILALSTGLHRLIRSVATGDLSDFHDRLRSPHTESDGKTLGVIGAGDIGGRVIQLARQAGMPVLVSKPRPGRWDDTEIRQVGLEELLAKSRFVSLHCPLDDDTRRIIRAETIALMPRGAYLINAARGGLVDHEDLIAALRSGHLAGAALDVQDPEPPPEDSELWSLDNLILTPHIGWKAIEARQRLIAAVAANIRAFRQGSPVNLVHSGGNRTEPTA